MILSTPYIDCLTGLTTPVITPATYKLALHSCVVADTQSPNSYEGFLSSIMINTCICAYFLLSLRPHTVARGVIASMSHKYMKSPQKIH